MIPLGDLKEKNYYVVGLARSGLATVSALKKAGATVYAFDDSQSGGVPPDDIDWDQIDALVLSPGIPHTFPKPHKAAVMARVHNVPIICDVDLLAQACPDATYIAVTGTNGKSTTTALLQHALPDAQMGGNIGRPVLDLDYNSVGRNIYLLELSSYQLECTPHLQSDVAVWLNISPDHIDRHGDFKGYIDAKKFIFAPKGKLQKIFIGIDDPESRMIYEDLKKDPSKTVVPISMLDVLENGISVVEGILYDSTKVICSLNDMVYLKGSHNHQNIAAVYGVIKSLGRPFDPLNIAKFTGLPHRQELIGEISGNIYINDSKATNIESTLRALSCYNKIHLILGGVAKDSGLKGIEAYKDSIEHAYIFGKAAAQFSKELRQKSIDYSCFDTLYEAVQAAFENAAFENAENSTILLSPACSSFDQYADFEERGDDFKKIVQQLQDRECSNE